MNSEEMYYLMHKDDIVTVVKIDDVSGSITQVAQKVRHELLPLGGNLSKNDLKKWWMHRAVPVEQKNIERVLEKTGIPTTQAYLLKNCGLSLADHYWMKPLDCDFTWEKVNLFTNAFKDDMEKFSLRGHITQDDTVDLKGKTIFYPSASAQGELQKKWIIKNDRRYLVKGNYGQSYQQSINEVIATLIHKKQGKVPYTEYRLCDIEINGSMGIGCICENFATESIEFIPAYGVVNSQKKENNISEYEHFIQLCVKNGLQEETVREFLEYQILTDFLITNTDRHFNNFGILRDTETLRFVAMAPVFDSGNSLFWNCPKLPKQSELLDIPICSFKKREIDMLKYVTNTKLLHLQKLPALDEIADLLQKNIDFEKNIAYILLGYQKKISLLEELQAGKKIWEYQYRNKKYEYN